MDDLHRVNGELPAEYREHCDGLPLPPDSVAEVIADRALASSSTGCMLPAEDTPYTIYEAIASTIEQMTGDPFPDPFTGDHDIEYWIWAGSRLVPAPPEVAERIRQHEAQERADQHLLRERQQIYRQQRWQSYRRFAKQLVSPLRHLVERSGLQ